ncbi:type IV secretory system conjugative DNA transfer family protein [Agathobaculum sp. LCP25S3_E8]|uniref:type IV secretory system conjugative DNA transfer family protein n=1 Tax=Agathobaculum sp. LCP25S3_E8 TaxID=3438735 RepID=UPI003F92A96A
MTTKELVWREVSIQRPYEMETLFNILTHIAALTSRGPVVWEARCKAGRMRYLVGTPKWSVGRVQEVFKAHANVQFTENVQREPVAEARKVKISKPVLSLNTEVSAAMIRATLAAMTGAKSDAECVVQIVLGAAFAPSTTPKNLPDPNATWLQAMLGSVHNASPEQRKAVREKAEQYTYDAVIRIGISGDHTTTRLHNIISALRTLESAGVHIHTDKEQPEHLDAASLPWRMPLRLSVKELACFLLLPAGEEELPGTPGLHPKLLLPPKWYREPRFASEKRHFATTLDTEPRLLSIAPKDALEHTILLGPTGSGKSTAMQHLILSDIRAGRSVLVLDPKADLVTDLLERIPEERKDDVVVIDPSDPSPVGFNPLMYNKDPSLTADAILAVFQELFAQNWGIRSADVLGGALLTLAQIKGANLLWLPQLLTDEHFRQKIVSQVKDPIALEPFWRHYDAMRDSERRTEIAPVLNKLRQITYRPGLRNVLGQSEPKFSLADLFLKRRIVLVPLNRGLIGAESARLLGSLIVGLTWTLALSRANVAPEKRHMVSVYVDELQDYLSLPTSFSDALAQARGLGVAYTVAHQYRGQLPPDIKAGIDANCRNKIIFGLNSDDAKDMAAQAPELLPLDFMTLPRYQIYTSFQSGGRNTGWISGQTMPPAPPIRMAAEIKAESMRRYGVPAEETEAALIRLMTRPEPEPDPAVTEAPIGRRKKL